MSRVVLPIVALAGVVACVLLLTADGDRYRVTAMLTNASGLRQDYSVRMAGATVGHVGELEVTDDDRVRVELVLDDEAAPLGRDARVAVRSANLFGEKYVELARGDVARPLDDGGVIPLARTRAPVEIDEVLDVLDEDTRTRLAALLNEAGSALTGRERDFNALLHALPNALDRTGALVAEFASDNRALGPRIERSYLVVAELARERDGLGQLVEQLDGAVTGFAARHRRLGETVDESAPTVAQLRRTLERIETLSGPLVPAADALRSTAPTLAATLRELPGFADAARPALRAGRRAAPAATALARAATPALRELAPTATETNRFASSLAPVMRMLEQGGAPDTLGTLEGWARAIQVRDGGGHLFRVSVSASADILESLVGTDPDDRPAAPREAAASSGSRDGASGERSPDAASRPTPASQPARTGAPDAPQPARPAGTATPAGPVNSLLDLLLGR